MREAMHQVAQEAAKAASMPLRQLSDGDVVERLTWRTGWNKPSLRRAAGCRAPSHTYPLDGDHGSA